jgi:hypothetical protein
MKVKGSDKKTRMGAAKLESSLKRTPNFFVMASAYSVDVN